MNTTCTRLMQGNYTSEIEQKRWSLAAGEYVGVPKRQENEFDVLDRLRELNDELEILSDKANDLDAQIIRT